MESKAELISTIPVMKDKLAYGHVKYSFLQTTVDMPNTLVMIANTPPNRDNSANIPLLTDCPSNTGRKLSVFE